MKIAVFVSGNGSNLQALIDSRERGELGKGDICLVVCDKPGVFALERARKHGIKTFVLETAGFDSREEYDRSLSEELDSEGIELIVLAGFMRILSKFFVGKYENKIINIHPAVLPSFKGAHGIKDAFEHGVKVTGVTVHFVTADLDNGPIILQDCLRIEETDSLESLEEKLHEIEHKLYPEAVRLITEKRIEVVGRKVLIR